MKQLLILSLLALLLSSPLFSQSLLEQADGFYKQRGENFNATNLLADPTNIDQAIVLYKKAIDSATDKAKEEAIWKLLRAYYFKGRYATKESDAKKQIFDLGKDLGEKSLKEFPESAGINLFLAIVWGSWGEEYGIFKAAKEGVAGKIKKYCEKVIELDPEFDHAGGYRVLGRVYFKAPKIWLILSWPSTDKAIEFFKKSLEIAPDNIISKQFLAEALYKKDKKQQAIKLMEEVLTVKEVSGGIAEDAIVKNEVKLTLADWKK